MKAANTMRIHSNESSTLHPVMKYFKPIEVEDTVVDQTSNF